MSESDYRKGPLKTVEFCYEGSEGMLLELNDSEFLKQLPQNLRERYGEILKAAKNLSNSLLGFYRDAIKTLPDK